MKTAPNKLALHARSLASVLGTLLLWEAAARTALVPPLFLLAFTTVIAQWWEVLMDGSLLADLFTSLFRALAGLVIAASAGVPLGIAMARSRFMHWMFDPIVALAFPSPKIAFLPIFILWFGIYGLSKILLVAFACVFPITIATYAAAASVSRVWIWSAYSLGTSRFLLLVHVILPAAWPRILAALRVALPISLITTFTAEMVGGGGGMGAALMYSQRFFESATVFSYILTMMAAGLILDWVMQKIQTRFLASRADGG